MSVVGQKRESGFTLMEMMVVIAIMGATLALIADFGPPRGHRLAAEAAARQVADAMRAARGEAVASGREVDVVMPPVPAWLAMTVAAPAGNKIAFFPDGGSSGGEVRLSAAGIAVDVSASWATGRVRVEGP